MPPNGRCSTRGVSLAFRPVTSGGERRPLAPPFADPARTGAWRSLSPTGSLPHLADRLDAESGANEHEAEVDVELIHLDATSYRQLAAERGPENVGEAVLAIVARTGKMQNPTTGSGGVLLGRLARVGAARDSGDDIGRHVVPLASLISTPLRLAGVGPTTTGPLFRAAGRAIVTGRMSYAVVPGDLPVEVVLTAIDVYPVASHTRARARTGDHVVILGAGHAGLCAAAAARDAVGASGRVTVMDRREEALEQVRSVDQAAVAFVGDATQPGELATEFARRGLPPADLTLVCTTAPGCEGSALLLTGESGTVLFFSTATSFAAAGLGADSLSSCVRLEIPNGFTPDRGDYLLELIRRSSPLRRALENAPLR